MSKTTRTKWVVFSSIAVMAVVLAAITGNFLEISQFKRVVHADPAGIQYTGVGACAAAACHGAPAAKPLYPGDCRHNENGHWRDKDLHARAYTGEGGKRGLTNKTSKDIAAKLKIADATKSERCLNCHGLSGISTTNGVSRVLLKPNEIVAKGYSVEDGVSCDACHGPAAKYLEPHVDKQWTAKQRVALGSEKLFDQFGLFDTKNLKFRANTCLSCHLKIDHELIAAGHPELPFELDSYSQGDWIHWQDKGEWFSSRAWAMGQVVSMREAAIQLGDRVKAKADVALIADSYKQMIAHAVSARQVAAVVFPDQLAAIDAQIAAANKDWANADAVAAAMAALGKLADGMADKLQAKPFDKAITEALLAGMAAEGEAAGARGFRSAEQITWGLKSLWGTIVKDAKPADGDKKMEKVDALYDPLGDSASYDAKKFTPAAKGMAEVFPGGKAIPLPPGGPAQ